MNRKCKCGRSFLAHKQSICGQCRYEKYYKNGKYKKVKKKEIKNKIEINQQMSIKQVQEFIQKNKPFIIIFHYKNERGKRYLKKDNQEIEITLLLYERFRKFKHEKNSINLHEFQMIFKD